MLPEIALVLLGFLAVLHLISQRQRPKNVPPGPTTLPIVGNLVQMIMRKREKPFDMFHDLSKIYGPIMSMKIGVINQVVLEEYKSIKEVLNSDIWMDRYFDDFLAQRSFGKEFGVLVINGGDSWKEMRRFSIRTLRDFGFGKQKSMEETLQDEFEDLTKSLNSELAASTSSSAVINMKQYFTISVLNILWNMIAGYRFDRDDAKLHNLLRLLDRLVKASAIGSPRMTALVAFPIVQVFTKLFTNHQQIRWELFTSMHQFFRDILKERRVEGHYKAEQRDFIDVFLREIDAHASNGPGVVETNYYTDEQFVVVCMDLFMAGSETTSNTLEFAILYMILHPEVQEKVQTEIDSVIGQNRFPSMLDKPKMPFTEATLLETQRMANVVPIIIRSPTESTTLGGYHIPKDTVGVINFHAMHMSKEEWDEPEKFQPERFLDNHGNVINANKILPFGSGKRSCLGEVLAKATLFTFFTTFLQKFSVSQSPNHSPAEMKAVLGFTLSPKPYHALVTPRLS